MADIAALEALYRSAFPDEDLLPLVRDLLTGSYPVLSLVVTTDGELTGHVSFTLCGVAGATGVAALLAPLAVAPHRQKQGLGSALVRHGLARLREQNVQEVLVLGDPAFYGRFGFAADHMIVPPYVLPDAWRDAWQALPLSQPLAGGLEVPPPWQNPALWGA